MANTAALADANAASGNSLRGRTAIVTGSTSGIGLGIARALAAVGANVTLNGISQPAEVEKTRADLAKEFGITVLYVDADLSDPKQVDNLVAKTVEATGKVDILVNNAGIQFVSPIEDFPAEKWNAIIALNLSAAFHGTKAVFAQMKQRKWGRIINIASAHGLIASPFKSAYVAAKHGVVGLTKTVALEGAEFGVTCNAICPGYVWTPLVEKQIPEQAKAHNMTPEQVIREVFLHEQPTKQFATVEEMGALAVFLCSDGAKNLTGTAIPVDGGWTAH